MRPGGRRIARPRFPFGRRPVSGDGAFRCGGPPAEPPCSAGQDHQSQPCQLRAVRDARPPPAGTPAGPAHRQGPARRPRAAPGFFAAGPAPSPPAGCPTQTDAVAKGQAVPGLMPRDAIRAARAAPTAGRGRRPQCEGGQNRYGCRSPNGYLQT